MRACKQLDFHLSTFLDMPSHLTSKQLIFTSTYAIFNRHICTSHLYIFAASYALIGVYYIIFTPSHLLSPSLSLSYSRPLPHLHILTLCHLPSYDDSHTYTYDYAPVRSRAIRTLVVKNVCTVEQQQQKQQQQQ